MVYAIGNGGLMKAISLKNGEQDEKLDYISQCMDYSDFKKSGDYKKIMITKNPYWRMLMVYLWHYVQVSGEKKSVEKHFKSFVNRLVLNENFQEWEERVRNKIRPVNSPEFDEIIYLEKENNSKYFGHRKNLKK